MADPITGDFGDVGIRRILSALFLRGVTARAAPGATVSRAAAGFGTVPRLGWGCDGGKGAGWQTLKGLFRGFRAKSRRKKRKKREKKNHICKRMRSVHARTRLLCERGFVSGCPAGASRRALLAGFPKNEDVRLGTSGRAAYSSGGCRSARLRALNHIAKHHVQPFGSRTPLVWGSVCAQGHVHAIPHEVVLGRANNWSFFACSHLKS